MQKSILIISGGSMGSLFSGFLKAASIKSGYNLDVTLRANWKEHRDAISKGGLHIHPHSVETKNLWKTIRTDCNFRGNNEETIIPITAIDDSIFNKSNPNYHKFDIVLLFEKSYNTVEAAKLTESVLSESGTCLTLQNGMGNLEILQSFLGKNRVLQGNTSQGASLSSPGNVDHGGMGYISISSPSPNGLSDAQWWVKTLNSIDLQAMLAKDNFEHVLWGKLLVNAAINPLTALYGMRNGELLKSDRCISLMKKIVCEGVDVANALKINLDLDECINRALMVSRQTAFNVSSMLSDIQKGNKTEIDYMNGYVVKKGKECGISTPINDYIVNLVHIKEDFISL